MKSSIGEYYKIKTILGEKENEQKKMMGVAAMAVAAMTITTVGGVSVYADDDINATVIWRAFDDQFQSGFRIIMGNEEENIGGIKLDMQDAENQVSVANNKAGYGADKRNRYCCNLCSGP